MGEEKLFKLKFGFSLGETQAMHASAENRRYRVGQMIWVSRCDPCRKADLVIDNTDWRARRLIRQGGG